MVPVEWVDADEWAAIELALSAVEPRSDTPAGRRGIQSQEAAMASDERPDAKRVRRQLPASWLTPPVSQYGAKSKLPRLEFKGRVFYSSTAEEAESAAAELLQSIESLKADGTRDIVLGFDTEWKPSFERGAVPGRTAVLQLCLDSSRCYVFHIFHSGIPPQLQKLLEEETISKAGIGISGDVSKLKLDYGVTVTGSVDLSAMANQKLKRSQSWSLSSLAEELTCKVIDKPTDIRCGDWELQPLSPAQLSYAATDAFASLHLYQALASFSNPVIQQSPSEQK
ncbi:Werner Syndrome-like exonuclease [Selaginella moellendorffii]|uniref:Werner Syndrome-like exonuclease n=1 Tax=Selaginella moellendorffii TaxID=88036 RepID=UPI000D1C6419|nr:Werner Syndrome-like exonuclease [Selaginella moellendorffii]|eukprot:XP_002974045.2 Werner Syndrome-like exonuclease [Selaginella moellendorffii]